MKTSLHGKANNIHVDKELSIDLSSDEFWFLLQQFGPAVVLGVQNPHLGWLIEEIEKADRTALRSLVDREIVRIELRI